MNRRIARNVLGGGAIAAALVLAGCNSSQPVETARTSTPPASLLSDGPLSPATPSTETTAVAEASNPVPTEAEMKSAWREGVALFEAKDYAEAAERLSVASLGRGQDPYAHYLLGLARWKSGDLEGAEGALATSVGLDATRVKTHVNLARVRMDLGRHADALEAAESALAIETGFVPALHQKGRALFALGKHDEGIESLRAAHELAPSDGQVANTYGWMLLQSGRPGESVAPLEKAREQLPSVAYVRNNLGVAYERTSRLGEALAEYRAAVEAGDPDGKARASVTRLEPVVERVVIASGTDVK
ncbi:MAG TPA: tetratricopeptide repeat protein [Candidatus Polarisedimenticolaceae bacterium]